MLSGSLHACPCNAWSAAARPRGFAMEHQSRGQVSALRTSDACMGAKRHQRRARGDKRSKRTRTAAPASAHIYTLRPAVPTEPSVVNPATFLLASATWRTPARRRRRAGRLKRGRRMVAVPRGRWPRRSRWWRPWTRARRACTRCRGRWTTSCGATRTRRSSSSTPSTPSTTSSTPSPRTVSVVYSPPGH